MAEIQIIKTDKWDFNIIYNEWLEMQPLGSYKKGGKIRLEFQFTNDNRKPFEGEKNPPPRFPISETKMTFNIKINQGFNMNNKNFTNNIKCNMEFI